MKEVGLEDHIYHFLGPKPMIIRYLVPWVRNIREKLLRPIIIKYFDPWGNSIHEKLEEPSGPNEPYSLGHKPYTESVS